MADARRLNRLRWLCRRGMKELDVLMEAFLECQATALGEGAWPELEPLLDEEDDRLWDWLQGRVTPPDDYASVIDAIRG